jgi:serine/threonine protein kinase
LETFITRSGPLTPAVAAKIITQLGAALGQAHGAGIIHRDLKPANIMYDPETQTAKLLDFGIARDAELPAEERLTRAGFFVGTLQYVAPEALSGELVGEQADVYSLAVIAYQLLTEVTPFPGKNPRELFQQLLTQDPITLNEAVKGLKFSARLEEVVMKGLAREPAKRWKRVGDFATAFEEAVNAEPEKKGGFLSSLFRRN